MTDSKLNEVIRTSFEKIRSVVDSDTIVGEPIQANGVTIIPISKVSVGHVGGGLDYFGKNYPGSAERTSADKLTSFSGGGGTGISVSPVGFLVIKADGNVEMLTVAAANKADGGGIADTIGDIIEKGPDWVEKIKAMFPKKDKDDETVDSE